MKRRAKGPEGRTGRSAIKLVVLALALLIVSVLPGLAASLASAGEPAEGKVPLGSTEVGPAAEELPAKRTAYSDTFQLPNGEQETRLYQAPVNYRDENGDWQPIEEALRETSSGAIVNGANSFDVRLPEDLNEAPVKLTTDGVWVSQRPLDISVGDAEMQGGSAAYPAAGQRAAFEYSGLANGLKEDIELADPSASSTYRFELEASAGVEAELTEAGAIEFHDPEGKLVATMPAPVMSDAAGAVAPPGAIGYRIEADGPGRWLLAVSADSEWLEAPQRAFPVDLDPSYTFESPSLDCLIANTSEANMCGTAGWTYLLGKANYASSGENQYGRSLLRFDLTPGFRERPIPTSASVTSATIGLYSAKTATNVSRVDLYDVSGSWEAGASWKYSTSQHNLFGKKWTAEGGDYGKYMPTPTSLTTAERGGSGPGWWRFSSSELAWLVQRWNSGGVLGSGAIANNGVLLKLGEETPRVCCIERRVEWESSAGANKPYLGVTYMLPASAAHITSPTDGTKTAKRFLLAADWDEGGVEAVSFQYRRKQEFRTPEEPWQNVPESQVVDQEGNAVAWPYKGVESRQSKPLYWDASSLTEGKTSAKLQVRAVVTHVGANSNYTQPVEVEVNKDSGSPKDAVTAIGPGSVDLITGDFTVTRSDVSIPGVTAGLDFSRSIQSRESHQFPFEADGVLGPGWRADSPVEEANSEWRSITIESGTETVEEEEVNFKRAELVDLAGVPFPFEEGPEEKLETPDELAGYVLSWQNKEHTQLLLVDTAGNRTVFKNSEASPNEYLPVSVSMKGGNESQLVYKIEGGVRRLEEVVAPAASGVNCNEAPTLVQGCRVLFFTYRNASFWGAPESAGMRLQKINYYAPGNAEQPLGGWEVAKYEYNTEGRLVAEWDPRISPALKETYTYTAGGQLATLTPAGLQPWTMEYGTIAGDSGAGRLVAVKRPSLVESSPTAQTTIAYAVPLSQGAGAPYAMQPKDVAAWGQKDVPTDATAIFPPNEVPSSPPAAYTRATVYYMDAEGQVSNVATPAGAGTEAPSITTTETDSFGNVVRELSAQNRLRALEAGKESATRSGKLDSEFVYDSDGYELLEELGPEHLVRLESGATAQARAYRTIQYDEGVEGIGPGEPMPGLPTTETTGAQTAEGLVDRRTTEYRYDWNLRMPKETVVDPGEASKGFLNLRSVTVYNSSGQVVESRQPSNPGGGGAGTTKTVYYKAGSTPSNCESSKWAGLPCKIEPAAQPATSGQPQLLVTKFLSYDQLGDPTEISESPGGGSEGVRKTVLTYDAAGRQLTKKITGGGRAVPKAETLYSAETGLPTTQRFVCESECEAPHFSTSVGYSGTGNGQLSNPSDVVLDSSGNLWVVDRGNNRIEEFDPSGKFIRSAGSLGSGAGQLNSPSGIAIDSYGDLDVTDSANNRIVRFDTSGAFVSAVGANVDKTKVEKGGTLAEKNHCTASSGDVCQAGTGGSGEGLMSEPIGITTSSGGNFFVVERPNNRVEKFNTNGELLAKFGSSGGGNGQLKEPTDIDSGGGYFWVTDTGNNRVEAWTSALAFSKAITGPAGSTLSHPSGIDVDASGHVWVGDQGNQRVQEFSESGTWIAKFGNGGAEEGEFALSIPMGLAAGAAGEVWVTDGGHNKVQKWTSGFDAQATTTTYDSLGRVTSYEDADGNKATTTYDLLGRPVTSTDARGSQTMSYDSVTGAPVKLEDSGAGTITASYDADGNLEKEVLPNGITQQTTYDETGAAVGRTYTKTSSCGTSCTWLSFSLQRSVYGQILSEESTLKKNSYSYDKAGRLKEAQETPTGGNCTTRSYEYDADSNRKTMFTREPGLGGACATTGGTKKDYSYDTADRLTDSGITYDNWGRITKLPASDAGGNDLQTSYFPTDLVATQSQAGVTNTFELDGAFRQRTRLQAGGLEGTEVFHYDGGEDSPAWTERNSTWTRTIAGIGGELVALQESGGRVTFRLTNLHGDVVAMADASPTRTSLLAAYSSDEFGNQTYGSAGRFGWLGGLRRRTELTSGVVQMGARSYIPQVGRFLSSDPVTGGSANAYDYAKQDPVNAVDPSGDKPYAYASNGPCEGGIHVWSPYGRPDSYHTYGTFYMRYWMNCEASGYVVSVRKVIRRFEMLGSSNFTLEHVHLPDNPSSNHWNSQWGNWLSGPPAKFSCLLGHEYQYTYEIVFEWASVLGAINKNKQSLAANGSGSLTLQAQEYCGHGRY